MDGTDHFVRLASRTENELLRISQAIKIPADAKGFRYWARYRCKNVQFGKSFVTDGRTMFQWLDNEGKMVRPSPHELIFATRGNKGTAWFEVEESFVVPSGATSLVVNPTLNRPKTGTLDITEVRLTVLPQAEVDAITAEEAAKAADKARIIEETATKKTADAAEVERMLKLPSKSLELKVDGNHLVTPDGRPIVIQGVNIPSMEWSAKGENILQSFKEALIDWKATAIRLPLNDNFWYGRDRNASRTDPPAGDPAAAEAYKKLVDDAVTLTASQGAHVILDLHRYMAPDMNCVTFWKDVAARYKNNPAVLFDLYNEPHSTTWDVWRNGGQVTPKGKDAVPFQSPGMQGLVDAVRGIGAKNVIVAGGLSFALDLSGVLDGSALEDKTGNGIMYAIHFYNWHGGWEKRILPIAEKYPVLVGEFGADEKKMSFVPANKQEDPNTWSPDALGFVQKYKLNWTAFCLHPAATPRLIKAWNYEPTIWGQYVKEALAGKQFELTKVR